MIYAGEYKDGDEENSSYYLYGVVNNMWTMSSAGFSSNVYNWLVYSSGKIGNNDISENRQLNPVINLNANVTATGTGTSSDPYVVQTN